MKLDLYDKKLLYHLDINSRYTLGELSKKVRLSKNAINYRINNLVKSGVIKQFYAVVNTKKLGYSYFKVYLKLQNTTETVEKEIIDYLKNKVPSLWVVSWEGGYDLTVGILAKGIEEFYNILNNITNRFRKYVQSYNLFIVVYAPHFKKGYLIEQQNQSIIEEFGGKTEIIEIDEVDSRILEELARDSRISIVELTERLDSTIDTIRYRLKKLLEKGIIQGFRIMIDYSKIGYQLYKVLITTQNLNEEIERAVVDYCSSQRNIADVIVKGVGSWNIELQIDAKDNQEFHEILKNFKNKFAHIIKNHETLLMIDEYKLNYFPFL